MTFVSRLCTQRLLWYSAIYMLAHLEQRSKAVHKDFNFRNFKYFPTCKRNSKTKGRNTSFCCIVVFSFIWLFLSSTHMHFWQLCLPLTRFFNKGQCTWGTNCRFLHPGVSDKGNYNMFAPAKPQNSNDKEEDSSERERVRDACFWMSGCTVGLTPWSRWCDHHITKKRLGWGAGDVNTSWKNLTEGQGDTNLSPRLQRSQDRKDLPWVHKTLRGWLDSFNI